MSNLSPTSLPITKTTASPTARARKRRAKRGIVANYIHEISPRHRASAPIVPAIAAPSPAPERAG